MRNQLAFWGQGTIPAVFNDPISLAFDGTFLWTCDMGNSLIQKINVTSLKVVHIVSLTSFGVTAAREIRYYSGHLYVSCLDSDLVIIINATSGSVVGKVLLSKRARSVTFDGGGNFFASAALRTSIPDTLYKFSIASVLAAYPGFGTATTSFVLAPHLETLTYGAGYVWASEGSPNLVLGVTYDRVSRIDPAAGTLVPYNFYLATNYQSINLLTSLFAFGSVWIAGNGAAGNAQVAVGVEFLARFDPATFAADPTAFVSLVSSGTPQGLISDGTYIWSVGFGGRVKRISTGAGTEAVVASLVTGASERLFDVAFDGTSIWAVCRDTSNRGLVRISTGVGTEAVNGRILNGG